MCGCMQPASYRELRERLTEVHNLDRASAVLTWDERTKMPPGGAAARADQFATLVRVKHCRMAADEIGRLLSELSSYEESLPTDSDEASLIRVARRDHEKARRVPADLEADSLARRRRASTPGGRHASARTSRCCCHTSSTTSSCAGATSSASTWRTPTTCCSTTSSPG